MLEDKQGDQARRELITAINDLNEDEQIELVALAWLGRGTYDIAEWPDALDMARDEHNKRTAQYLLSLPLLGDYLEEGLEAFGDSIVDMDDTRDPATCGLGLERLKQDQRVDKAMCRMFERARQAADDLEIRTTATGAVRARWSR